jgi:hypothetical protein
LRPAGDQLCLPRRFIQQSQIAAKCGLRFGVRFETLKFLPVRIFGGRDEFTRLQCDAGAGFQPFHDPFRLPFSGADNFGKLFEERTVAAGFLWCCHCAKRNCNHGKFLTKKKARTQRALHRGTAKRLSKKHAKPRPLGRARSVL